MAPSLDTIPADVHVQIALYLARSSPFQPPVDVLNLSLTSKRMNSVLNIRTCPHLYSQIFQERFDLPFRRRPVGLLTDTALAAELVQRCRCLRYIKDQDISEHHILDVLWRCLWMVLENIGRNEEQLSAAGFPAYLETVFTLSLSGLKDNSELSQLDTASLASWLAVLTWSSSGIADRTEETRDAMALLLRPFASPSNSHTNNPQHSPATPSRSIAGHEPTPATFSIQRYGHRTYPHCPSLEFAAIILTHALHEATVPGIPQHLPVDRVTAQLFNHTGATQADYIHLSALKTPFLADTIHALDRAKSKSPSGEILDARSWMMHDVELERTLRPLVTGFNPYQLTCERMAGLWEGAYMPAPMKPQNMHEDQVAPNSMPMYLLRIALQCNFEVHLGFEKCFFSGKPPKCSLGWRVRELRQHEASQRKLTYVKWSPGEDPQHLIQQASQCILVGETTESFEEAWGTPGFRYIGMVQRNGSIVVNMKSKGDAPPCILNGQLRYGEAFVGTYRSMNVVNGDDGVRGIFSLNKSCVVETS